VKKYIENLKQKPPHERRQAAMRLSLGITGVIFVGWLATLGVRLSNPGEKTAQSQNFESQVASIFSAFTLQGNKPNTLEVASTTQN
jgi:hypothetical protein